MLRVVLFAVTDSDMISTADCCCRTERAACGFIVLREVPLPRKQPMLSLFGVAEQEDRANAVRTPSHSSAADTGDAANIWQQCLTIIRDNVSSQHYRTWFEPIKPLRCDGRELVLQVPSQFFYEWLEEHYYGLLQKTLYQVLGTGARLRYEVVVEHNSETLEERTIRLPAFRQAASPVQAALPFSPEAPPVSDFAAYLNRRYTFANFIAGESNQLAYSAACAVAEHPGKTRFNPLVIYGATGLGKTHLVQAIGNRILERNRTVRVLYTTSERFTIEYINAIQNNKTNEFTAFYRSVDVLIVDDIQFFEGKEKTQDNFFHTFNALHQLGKQIILTSDRPPKELRDVDERLISRFQWGLTADIQLPDYEMRLAILQRKSQDEGVEIPRDVLEYIARHVTTSVRELEGCLISLIAKVSLDGRQPAIELAKEVLRGLLGPLDTLAVTMDDIKNAVAAYFNVQVELLESKTRKHEIVLPRQVAMYLAKQLTALSLKSIGLHFGGRDHTTVLHSIQVVEAYLSTDPTVTQAVEQLRRKLKT
ncbi:MAG: chromosomal replication initiator protein DnaA [Chlorobi bacterium]|nr:chromosomal replication initiator protein DnaA [Chlorobiota bacterium]